MMSRRTFSLLGISASAAAAAAAVGLRMETSVQAATDGTFEITKTPEEWKNILTPDQFYVLRQHGTERPFTSPLDKLYEPGTYHCAGCDLAAFSSETKYDSRTGWPSFWKPLDNAIGTTEDRKFLMVRTEVHCRRCGGHFGHVFEDGPPPTGLRYCMNGLALTFKPANKAEG